MGCCGQKRADLKGASVPTTAPAVTQPARKEPLAGYDQQTPVRTEPVPYAVMVRYLESSPILVRGPVTGRSYRFSKDQSVQPIDPRDAEVLVRTRFFRRNV